MLLQGAANVVFAVDDDPTVADPDAFKRVESTQDKDGRIYDSRNGLGGYYRYGPRSVAALSDTKYSDDKRDSVKVAMPKIHQSVFSRIAVAVHFTWYLQSSSSASELYIVSP